MITKKLDNQRSILRQSLGEEIYASLIKPDTPYFAGVHDTHDVSILSIGEFERLSRNDFSKNMFVAHLKDKHTRVDLASWAGILRMYNIMQFLDQSLLTTQKGIDDALYDGIDFREPSSADTDWSLIYEEVLDEAKNLVKILSKNPEIPLPDVGVEITDKNGTVLGEAEMIWETLKLGVVINTPPVREGWSMFRIDETDQIIEALLQRITS